MGIATQSPELLPRPQAECRNGLRSDVRGCCGGPSASVGPQSDFQQARTPGMLVSPGCRGQGIVLSVLLNTDDGGLSQDGVQCPVRGLPACLHHSAPADTKTPREKLYRDIPSPRRKRSRVAGQNKCQFWVKPELIQPSPVITSGTRCSLSLSFSVFKLQ